MDKADVSSESNYFVFIIRTRKRVGNVFWKRRAFLSFISCQKRAARCSNRHNSHSKYIRTTVTVAISPEKLFCYLVSHPNLVKHFTNISTDSHWSSGPFSNTSFRLVSRIVAAATLFETVIYFPNEQYLQIGTPFHLLFQMVCMVVFPKEACFSFLHPVIIQDGFLNYVVCTLVCL